MLPPPLAFKLNLPPYFRTVSSFWTPDTLLLLTGSFLAGGLVKGVIGTGLPTVALALLTITIGLKEGMAIIVLPSLLTNIEQGLFGGNVRSVLFRYWSFFLSTGLLIWVGASLITRVNTHMLSAILGFTLILYSCFGLTTRQFQLPPEMESWLNPVIGSINGLLTGMTGSSVVPGVLYLQGLQMSRELFIQTMGLLFLISSASLGFALQKNQLFTTDLAILSFLAFIPAYAGMRCGRWIRHRITEETFRRFFFIFMLFLGAAIITRALLHDVGGNFI